MRACQPQRHKPEDSVFATDAVSFLTLKVYPAAAPPPTWKQNAARRISLAHLERPGVLHFLNLLFTVLVAKKVAK
jgi:hypothetical protein